MTETEDQRVRKLPDEELKSYIENNSDPERAHALRIQKERLDERSIRIAQENLTWQKVGVIFALVALLISIVPTTRKFVYQSYVSIIDVLRN